MRLAATEWATAGVPYVSYILIAAGFGPLLLIASRSRARAKWLLVWPLLSAFALCLILTIWLHHVIATSLSSTAAVGYVFLPLWSVVFAVVGFVLSWSLLYAIQFVSERTGLLRTRITSPPIFAVAVLMLFATGWVALYQMSRHNVLVGAGSVATGADRLQEITDRAIASYDVQTLASLASNPSLSPAELLRIYDACKDRAAISYAREYPVFHSLARNRLTPPEVLAALARHEHLRIDVAMNPTTPTETLSALAEDKDSLVRAWLASNPKLPRELLLKLANDPDRVVRSYAETYLQERSRDMAP